VTLVFKIKRSVLIIFAFLILGGAGVVWSQRSQPTVEEVMTRPEVRSVEEKAAAAADLVLDFGEKKIATYSGVRVAEKTVLGLLLQAAQDNGFEVNYNPPSGGMGAFVKSIGGVENTNEKFWQFWVNGEYGQVAMDQQEIKNGDIVEVKFGGFEQ
jgi:hypothetical protein